MIYGKRKLRALLFMPSEAILGMVSNTANITTSTNGSLDNVDETF